MIGEDTEPGHAEAIARPLPDVAYGVLHGVVASLQCRTVPLPGGALACVESTLLGRGSPRRLVRLPLHALSPAAASLGPVKGLSPLRSTAYSLGLNIAPLPAAPIVVAASFSPIAVLL